MLHEKVFCVASVHFEVCGQFQRSPIFFFATTVSIFHHFVALKQSNRLTASVFGATAAYYDPFYELLLFLRFASLEVLWEALHVI